MEIENKLFQLDGIRGYSIKGANISLCLDSVTDSYSVMLLGIHRR